MSDEPEFGNPVSRRTDPGTSVIAAANATFKASKGRLLALNALLKHGPLTDFELAHHTGWKQTSIGKRRGECMKAKLVEAAMDGVVAVRRPSEPGGSPAQVWQLTEKGREYARNHEQS